MANETVLCALEPGAEAGDGQMKQHRRILWLNNFTNVVPGAAS